MKSFPSIPKVIIPNEKNNVPNIPKINLKNNVPNIPKINLKNNVDIVILHMSQIEY
jgi:hypothetical protein